MGERLFLVFGDSGDPWRNLAVEQTLLETVEPDARILYLWQNRRTVVIGRNQNAWRECRLSALEEDGGRLARRLSGGGAVYHDLGNLNFTFLVRKERYDLERQLGVVIEACRGLGLTAVRSGRNDLLCDGRKFSGNAFFDTHGQAYHHGTLMLDVDTAALARYLSPSRAKLEAKGVPSVRARVVNLCELRPGLTAEDMRDAMSAAFGRVFDGEPRQLPVCALDPARIAALTARNGSFDWLYGRALPFTCCCEARFAWGEVRCELRADNGIIREALVFTDAMDWSLSAPLSAALKDCALTADAVEARLRLSGIEPAVCADIVLLFQSQLF